MKDIEQDFVYSSNTYFIVSDRQQICVVIKLNNPKLHFKFWKYVVSWILNSWYKFWIKSKKEHLFILDIYI